MACSKISLACGYAQIWTFYYLQFLPLFGFLVWHQIDSSKTSTAQFLLKNISSCNQGSWILGSGCVPARTLSSLLEFQHFSKQVKTGLFIHRDGQASQLVVKESSGKWRLMPETWKIHRSCLKAAIRFLQKKSISFWRYLHHTLCYHTSYHVCLCVVRWKCCKL